MNLRVHIREKNQLGVRGKVFKGTDVSLPNFRNRTPQKEGAFVQRVLFKNGHNEYETLEVLKPQHPVRLEMFT